MRKLNFECHISIYRDMTRWKKFWYAKICWDSIIWINAELGLTVNAIIDWELCIWHSFLDIDECEGRNCSEQGECQDGIDDYTCNCNNGFTGKDCETGTVASQISDATEIFSLFSLSPVSGWSMYSTRIKELDIRNVIITFLFKREWGRGVKAL